MSVLTRIVAIVSLAVSVGGCLSESPAAQYLRRTDTITTSAGNAKEVNAATNVIDPWGPGVGDPRIHANGDRMVGAMERYRRQGAPQGSQAPGQPPASSPGGAALTGTGSPPLGDRSTLPY